jgi:hypothetical protein
VSLIDGGSVVVGSPPGPGPPAVVGVVVAEALAVVSVLVAVERPGVTAGFARATDSAFEVAWAVASVLAVSGTEVDVPGTLVPGAAPTRAVVEVVVASAASRLEEDSRWPPMTMATATRATSTTPTPVMASAVTVGDREVRSTSAGGGGSSFSGG